MSVRVKKGSVVKLVYSDGHEVHWTAAEDVTLSRALDTIARLSRLDPEWVEAKTPAQLEQEQR
jgi:hypothetical protein